MESRSAWLLNLDADLELEGGRRYQPTTRVLFAMQRHVEALARTLMSEGDVLVTDDLREGALRDASPPFVGRAFMPTPRAIARLERIGAALEKAPPFEVLQRVNSRAFSASLGSGLVPSLFTTSREEALRLMSTAPREKGKWRLKRAFGMAGRGHRTIAHGIPEGDDLSFLLRALDAGGVLIEPEVEIVRELGLHGFLAEDGSLETGVPVEQRSDARGQWSSSRLFDPATESSLGELSALHAELHRVARALYEAGYHGPFGIDAFLYLNAEGAAAFQPRSEINARFSMGFPIGFGKLTSRAMPCATRR